LLRVCAHVPHATAAADLTALRVLLIADLLARTAELGGLQALTALEISGPVANEAALESDARALGIHPPTVRAGSRDTPSPLGGPIDVHLISEAASVDPGHDELFISIGAAYLDGAGSHTDAAAEGLLAGQGGDPRSVRLALMSFPSDRPAELTGDGLTVARDTLAHWRQRVALWAESPSRPIPTSFREQVWAAFADLDTLSVFALLQGLSLDASVPEGAKFETFVYADRVLGLDLAREIGQPVARVQTRPG
jgi:hypothetical protein